MTPYVGLWPQATQAFGAPATSAVVTGLSSGSTYRFRVQAVNGYGISAPSASSNPVTPT